MLYTCKSRSKHSSSKCKLHTLIFSSAGNFSCCNFCFHAIFNTSSRGSQYKCIFSSLEILELLPQPTAAHITIVKIIFTKFYYKTIFRKIIFSRKLKLFCSRRKCCLLYTTYLNLINKRLCYYIFSCTYDIREKREKPAMLTGRLQHKTEKKGKRNISNINENFSSKLFLWSASTSNFHILKNWYWQDNSFNILKTRTAMKRKMSMFVILVETIIYSENIKVDCRRYGIFRQFSMWLRENIEDMVILWNFVGGWAPCDQNTAKIVSIN